MLAVAGLNLAPQVERVMKYESISAQELAEMLNKAAITTHQRGNRKFHAWVFEIKQGTVWRMSHGEDVFVRKLGSVNLTAYEECEHCEGDTCRECGYSGEQCVTYYTKK